MTAFASGVCHRCGLRNGNGRMLCPACLALLLACRRAVMALVRESFVEQVGEHAYLFSPEAQAWAELLAQTEPSLMDSTLQRIARTEQSAA